MYIEKIILKNFRGASDLTIDLDRHLNVFYGENGAGKSTVLDAAAIMLSWVANRIGRKKAQGRPISELDIQNDKPFSAISLVCKGNEDSQLDIDTQLEFDMELVKNRKGYRSEEKQTNFSNLNQYVKAIQHAITEYHGKINIPLFVYYPVKRAVIDIPLRIRDKHSFDLLDAYDEALTGGASFRTFFEWFRENEDLENEYRRDMFARIEDERKRTELSGETPEDQVFDSASELIAVRHALEQFMPDFKNFRIHRSPLRMEVEKNGELLIVNQLSDGEKCLMAMVGDLARRLAIATANRDHLSGKGIVLIDEIDLHLHPKWQRTVVPKLREIFPNVQFIISTHSPHILNHVQAENLFVLKQTPENIEVSHPNEESYGKDSVSILEDFMGLETTRPLRVQKDLDRLYQFIQRKKTDEAKSLFKKLKRELEEDHDLVTAKILIKRLEDSCE